MTATYTLEKLKDLAPNAFEEWRDLESNREQYEEKLVNFLKRTDETEKILICVMDFSYEVFMSNLSEWVRNEHLAIQSLENSFTSLANKIEEIYIGDTSLSESELESLDMYVLQVLKEQISMLKMWVTVYSGSKDTQERIYILKNLDRYKVLFAALLELVLPQLELALFTNEEL